MPCYALAGIRPVVDPSAYVHPTAVLIGDVIVGPGAYVGPVASLRGDFGPIRLAEGVNIQDNCTLHGFPGVATCVEEDGHIGHGAILHACHIRRGALVGMNAVVMDGAIIGEQSIVAALSFIKAGLEVPRRSLVAGVPGRIVREVTDQEYAWKSSGTRDYHNLAKVSSTSMVECQALTEAEPGRDTMTFGHTRPLYQTKAAERDEDDAISGRAT